MNTKTVAKKTPARKTDERAASRRRLAAAIAEIMRNPETPSELHNPIGDITIEWQDAYIRERGLDSESLILDGLEAYHRAEEKRAGGRR